MMIKYLKSSPNSHLIFTNTKLFLDPEDKEENPKYQENVKALEEANQKLGNKIQVFEQSPLEKFIQPNGNIMLNESLKFSKESVCLLDMRSKKMLAPSDAK